MARRSGRSTSPPTPRARIWIERNGKSALSESGADLLEQIHATGSLSEAARRLGFSYRRAWMLLDSANRLWERPLVTTAIGGRHGGGARLTEFGARVLRSFRDLQIHIEAAIDHETEGFRRTTRAERG